MERSIPTHRVEGTPAGITILVVEDQESVRSVTVRMLSQGGYRVLQASDGQDALRVFDAQRDTIHMVLTDIVMPDMQGTELSQQLLARSPGIKVLFMSGYGSDSAALVPSLSAHVRVLEKPFSRADLLGRVRELIGSIPSP
jgi:CheY-like chemotaxis protein